MLVSQIEIEIEIDFQIHVIIARSEANVNRKTWIFCGTERLDFSKELCYIVESQRLPTIRLPFTREWIEINGERKELL